jgi:anti-sigma regulatory factor (Ser/Thr protein kinase)/GNAT superfamily N-acetyltransferase
VSGAVGSELARLTIRNDAAYLPAIIGFTEAMAGRYGVSEERRRRLQLAVEEAVRNVIDHAFPADTVATFDVIVREAPLGLEVAVHDDGLPFDPSFLPDFDPAGALGGGSSAGLGELLMSRLVDEFRFINLGPGGKEARFVVHVTSPVAMADVAGGTKPPEADTVVAHDRPPEAAPSVPTVRLMEQADALDVTRCVYDSYGYTYDYEDAYFPDRIAAYNRSGHWRSAVAVDADGGIVGHTAIVFDEHLAPEIAVGVVRRDARAGGVATALGAFLEEEARRLGVAVLTGKPVMVHPYTQRVATKLGLRDCGLLLAFSPKSKSIKGIDESATHRTSWLVSSKRLVPAEPRPVFPPERHREMVEWLLASIGHPVLLGASPGREGFGEKGEGTESRFDLVSYPARGLAFLHVAECGADLVARLRPVLRRLRLEEVAIVFLLLPLGDPRAPDVVPGIESLGFFFTGIMPGTVNGDCMIFEYLNGVAVDYSGLVAASSAAQRIVAYVAEQDPGAE